MTKTNSGAPVPHAVRQERGAERVDLYVPEDAVADLRFLAAAEATATGVPAARARTPAIVRAIREQARRDRKKVGRKT